MPDVHAAFDCFSTLQRVEIAEMSDIDLLMKTVPVSVLFNESKLLKTPASRKIRPEFLRFSTLQRVEIAEIQYITTSAPMYGCFSTLQRVEIAEIRRIVV